MTNKDETWAEVAARTYGVSVSRALLTELQASREACLNAKRYLAAKFELTDSERNSLACLDEACILSRACSVMSSEQSLREELREAHLEIARLRGEQGGKP